MTETLGLARYRVTVEALDDLALPVYLGSTLRGAFGHAFRALCCPAGPDEECPVRESVHAFYDRHYRGWLDTPLPALQGKTPRAAAAATGKAQVVPLLKDLESHAARDRLAGRPAYEFGWLWGALGLDRP